MDETLGPRVLTDAEQRRLLIDLLIHELQQRDQHEPGPQADPVEPRAVKWVKGMMPTFIALFGFGGQITFTVIPTITHDDDVPSAWGAGTVRTFLSLAWMFFTLGFGLSCAVALTYAYGGDAYTDRLRSGSVVKMINAFCAVLQLFTALAFFFLALVVEAYTPVVGWLIIAISSLAIVISIGVFVIDTWL